MDKNRFAVTLTIFAVFISASHADNSMANQTGVGARALSFANNYVAAANDMSSVYWNPAALAFLPVREAQASFDVLSNTSTTEYYGTQQTSDIRRLRIASAGCLFAVPASRGGLTFAGALQSPYVFERNPSFHGIVPATRIQREDLYRGYGSLHFWSGGVGIQVAPGVGIGISPSLVTGKETIKERWSETDSGLVTQSGSDDVERTYIGYDLRIGALYKLLNGNVLIGGRFVVPQRIWFTENSTYSGTYDGELTSSFSGAVGAAGVLPFGTVSTEFRFRAPYDFINPADVIPESSPAHHSKNGAGIGAEIPIFKTNALVRCGYSWDQFDLYQFAMKYANEPVGSEYENDLVGWGTSGITVNNDRQELTAGCAYISNSIGFEASYGYQFWNLTTNNRRSENEHLQRGMVSMSVRF